MDGQTLEELAGKPRLRQINGKPYRTDNGNYIFDCIFPSLSQPCELEISLNKIPGVVENGLFIGMADLVISLDGKNQTNFLKKRRKVNGSNDLCVIWSNRGFSKEKNISRLYIIYILRKNCLTPFQLLD